ncbi:hypothetical protein [Psychroserpens sp. NJDZ02]|uniref:hypothetical protein n=1 Tax=Psychroserpens sp. NJDZ02 TaxID=2570561 RepID=UPI0010A89631|nr:hypothetical protein [Psychroserpens sp. NJDZ02]QCE42346.1 hypothetical protein E9099_13345 [Psychroserpens sp. NJDZ02]
MCFYSLIDVSAPVLVISEIDLNTNITTTHNFECIISNFGNQTEYIDVAFSGDFTDSAGGIKSITGTIHIRKNT